jgi:hypothetical protein
VCPKPYVGFWGDWCDGHDSWKPGPFRRGTNTQLQPDPTFPQDMFLPPAKVHWTLVICRLPEVPGVFGLEIPISQNLPPQGWGHKQVINSFATCSDSEAAQQALQPK